MPNIIHGAEVYKVIFYSKQEDQVAFNVTYWQALDVDPASTISDLFWLQALLVNVGSTFADLMNNNASFLGGTMQKVMPAMDLPRVESDNGANPGTAGDVAMPKQTSGIARKFCNRIGKAGLGRMYLPFPAAADNETTGVPTADYLARINVLCTKLLTPQAVTKGGVTVTLVMGLWHRQTGFFDQLQDMAGVLKWATQRRRGAFGRSNQLPF